MWNPSPNISLPAVLIIENDKGDVFIVEDEKSESLVEKILNQKEQLNEGIAVPISKPAEVVVTVENKANQDDIIELSSDEETLNPSESLKVVVG